MYNVQLNIVANYVSAPNQNIKMNSEGTCDTDIIYFYIITSVSVHTCITFIISVHYRYNTGKTVY